MTHSYADNVRDVRGFGAAARTCEAAFPNVPSFYLLTLIPI
jgi:hypothetical protein